MSAKDDCGVIDFGCKVTGTITDGIAAIAMDWLEKAAAVIEWLATRWLHWSPGVDTESNAVLQIQQNLWWYTAGIAMLGILVALGKMVLSNDFKSLIGAAKPIVNLIIVTGVYTVGIAGLITAGDELAKWLFEKIDPNLEGSTGMAALGSLILMSPQGVQNAIGGALLVGMLALLGSIVLFCFMLFRDVMLLVLLAFVPSLAAATGTETGDQMFKKTNGWLVALLLFKPVAAAIMALGLTLMVDNTDINGDAADGLMRPLSGVLIMLMASLALPALVKFIVPAAAAGAGAFSGGAALTAGAAVAAGAAVITATGGAGAAAGGVAGGAGTTGGAGGAAGGAGSTGLAGGASSTPGGGEAATTTGAGADASGSGAATSPAGGGSSPGTGEESTSDSTDTGAPSSDTSDGTTSGAASGASTDTSGGGQAADGVASTPTTTAGEGAAPGGAAPGGSGGGGGSDTSALWAQSLSDTATAAQGSADEAVEGQ